MKEDAGGFRIQGVQVDAGGYKGMQGGAGGSSQQQPSQQHPSQQQFRLTIADQGRPSPCDIRGATCISDSFIMATLIHP